MQYLTDQENIFLLWSMIPFFVSHHLVLCSVSTFSFLSLAQTLARVLLARVESNPSYYAPFHSKRNYFFPFLFLTDCFWLLAAVIHFLGNHLLSPQY
jgi:hypothetical protein